MTTRADMDRPATVLTALLGIVLIAASLPFLFEAEGAATRYTVTWAEAEAASDDATLTSGQTATITIPVTDLLPSNATVTIDCTDSATPPLQGAVTVRWRLFEGSNTTPIDEGTTGCPETGFPVDVPLGGHPDIASMAADSASDAEDAAESQDARSTSYRLEVQVTRAAGTGPGLPIGQPQFTGTATLAIHEWTAVANDPDEEATR